MFIAIAHTDHSPLFDNCDAANESYGDFYTMTDNPVFIASSFEKVCASIARYYKSFDEDECPGYNVYPLGESWWKVKGTHTVTMNVERRDA